MKYKKKINNDKRKKRKSKRFIKRNNEKRRNKNKKIFEKLTNQIKIAKIIYLLILAFIYIFSRKYMTKYCLLNKKRVGVIHLANYQNVGNALVKYSIFKS